MRKYYRSQKRICTEKGKYISIVKNREREGSGSGVFKRSIEKGIYLTTEITINITSVFCAEEEWKEENDAKLQIFEQLNN